MADNEIKVNLNADEFSKNVNEIKKSTKSLEDSLKSVGVQAGVAFAGFTGLIYKSIQAYGEQEKAVNTLNQALKTQGIFSEQLSKQYQDQASQLQSLTTYGDEAIVAAQAQLQAYTKNKQVTKELTKATLDFAQAQGVDLQTAASLVGKSIGTGTNALARYGVAINTSATASEKLEQVVGALNRRFGGQAEAATQGLGSLIQLKNVFGDVFEEIGKRLAPTVVDISKKLTAFFQAVINNGPLIDMIANIIKVGAALTGSVTVIVGAVLAFNKLSQVIKFAGIALELFGGGIRGIVGATGIGLLILVISDLALNWNLRFKQMQAVFQAFTNNIAALGQGLTSILAGVFTLNTDKITAGLAAVKDAFVSGIDEYNNVRKEQNDKEVEDEKAKQEAILEAQREARIVQTDEYTTFLEEFTAQNEEYAALNSERQQEFNTAALDTVRTQLQNENSVRNQFAQEALKKKIETNNKYLQEQIQFGAAYATINKIIATEEIKGLQQTANAIVGLQNSSNSTLKTIGKAGAVTQITIDTAKNAASAFGGAISFLGPFIGPVVGAALAGAIIAYGGEQIGKVVGAAQGGVVPGANPVGRGFTDTQPALLTPGELVVPRKNYDEVINAVAAARNNEASLGEGAGQNGNVAVMIGFDGAEASQVLTARQNEDTALGISRAFA